MRLLCLLVFVLMFATSCFKFNASDSVNTRSSDLITGQFLDSAVSGLDYKRASKDSDDTTDSSGSFTCKEGETLIFKLRNVVLGTTTCSAIITPVELVISGQTYESYNSLSSFEEAKIAKLLVFFQTLDTDGNPENGIHISTYVKGVVEDQVRASTGIASGEIALDYDNPELGINMDSTLDNVVDEVNNAVGVFEALRRPTENDAKAHFVNLTLDEIITTEPVDPPASVPETIVPDTPSDALVLLYNTALPLRYGGYSNTISLRLGAYTEDVTNVSIDWGDATANATCARTVTSKIPITCTYPAVGTYEVSISGQLTHLGPNDASFGGRLVGVVSWGTTGLTSLENAFRGEVALIAVPSNLPSTVWNVRGMFWEAFAFNDDISTWDVSNVTYMTEMFRSATSFNQDISGWNVSNAEYMNLMFSQASAFNQNVGSWDVSSVINMSQMFESATSFNQDISGWNLSSATDISYMFYAATSFNQNISPWNVSGIKYFNSMFKKASSFNQNIGVWNTSSAINMSSMFEENTVFNQDISGWNVAKVQYVNSMFRGATAFNQDLSGWCTSAVVPAQDPGIYFDQGATSWVLGRPVWGTCP